MDAKPQRPARLTRVYNDENAVPSIGLQKTIHQRHKSSPSLITMANAGGMKTAPKRIALGDASNATNAPRHKDDSAIATKAERAIDKVAPLPCEKRTTALLKPAQRPSSTIQAGNVAQSTTTISTKQPLAGIPQSAQPAVQSTHSRRVLQKRSTTFVKDTVPAVTAVTAKQPPAELSQCSTITNTVVPVPGDSHCPLPPRHQQLSEDRNLLPTISRPINDLEKVSVEPSIVSIPLEEHATARSDGVYIDDDGVLQQYQFPDELEAQDLIDQISGGVALPQELISEVSTVSSKRLDEEAPKPVETKTMQPPRNHRLHLLTVSEPEEYWDDEEEGNYEEEDYVTSRSYRSRGENTTGGATTVLFPNPTQKSRKELAAAKALMEAAKAAEEVDDETWDTTMVAEYGDEIFQYMNELEIQLLPNAHYMDNQAEIQWSMRSVLMDWLVQVHHRFGLLPETLFLCCNYIDRFLSCKVVSLGKLQLVGATAIFIAAKYEEINCPSVQEIVYMVDNGYTADEILKAERFMLAMLNFELGWPGPMSFLRRISKADDYDLETRTLAKYFLEITIMDERFIGSPPSFLAAGAHCLARMMLRKGSWTVQHVYFSGYTFSQINSLIRLMLECCDDPQKHHCAIYDKYADKRYKRASQFVQSELNKGFQAIDLHCGQTSQYPAILKNQAVCAY